MVEINIEALPRRSFNFTTRVLRRRLKSLRQTFSPQSTDKQYLFVVGCQRSGTSMMYKVFEHDTNAGVYDEISALSSQDKLERLRLNPFEDVLSKMSKNPASLVVAKPLVESQNLVELLRYFPNSKAIWMFRPYKDVVQSNLRRFGMDNGLTDIKPIIDNNTENWRAEKVHPDIRKFLLSHINDTTSEYDAAALFWYIRNSHYFQQKMYFNGRVFLCNYDNLVANPATTIKQLYKFLGRGFPGRKTAQGINPHSIGKGNTVKLAEPIRNMCDNMLHRLISNQHN